MKPTFSLPGTQEGDKKIILYDTDHILPRAEYIKETLAWLDKYLGPVKKRRCLFPEKEYHIKISSLLFPN